MGNMTFRELLGILRGGQKVRLHAKIGNNCIHVWTMCREVSEFLKSETYGYTYGWPVKDVRTNDNESVLDVEFACFFTVSNT